MRTRYLDIEDRTDDLHDLMKDRPEQAREFLDKLELSWIYHEAALDGVVLTGGELQQAFDLTGILEADRSLVFQEVRNFKNAVDVVRNEAKHERRFTMDFARNLYEIVNKGIPGRLPLELRKDMPLHRTYFHDIAHPHKIEPGLVELFDHMNSADFRSEHAIRQAVSVHHTFMVLFPFGDYSGKVARLLMNVIMLRAGYLPVVIPAVDRQRYYDALRLPHVQFRAFVLDMMQNGLDNAWRFFYPPEERREAAND